MAINTFLSIFVEVTIALVIAIALFKYVGSLQKMDYFEDRAIAYDTSYLLSAIDASPYPIHVVYDVVKRKTEQTPTTGTLTKGKFKVGSAEQPILLSADTKGSFTVGGLSWDFKKTNGYLQTGMLDQEKFYYDCPSFDATVAQRFHTKDDDTPEPNAITINFENNNRWPDGSVLIKASDEPETMMLACHAFNAIVATGTWNAGSVIPLAAPYDVTQRPHIDITVFGTASQKDVARAVSQVLTRSS